MHGAVLGPAADGSARVWTRGDVLGGAYRLDELVGSGGFGVVFRATELASGSAVAIKLLRPPWDEERRARFEREARLARKLDHPNVVRVVDAGEADGAPFIAFEWLEGTSLAAALAARGAFSESLAAQVTAGVLSALEAIHAAGVIHRDIKPSNVLLCGSAPYEVKLLDLGVAKPVATATSPALTAEGLMIGTVAYMAPEQIDSRPAEAASDLYGVGLILAEMLLGKPVYDVPAVTICAQKLRGVPPPFSELHRSSALWAVIDQATRFRASERPASAAAMRASIAARVPGVASLRATSGPPSALQPRPKARSRRRAIAIAAIGLACCGALLAAWLMLRDPPKAPRGRSASASAGATAQAAHPPPRPCAGLDRVDAAMVRATFFPPPAVPVSGKEDVLDFIAHWFVGGNTRATLYEFPEQDPHVAGYSREEYIAMFADRAHEAGQHALLGKTKFLSVGAPPAVVAEFERAHCR